MSDDGRELVTARSASLVHTLELTTQVRAATQESHGRTPREWDRERAAWMHDVERSTHPARAALSRHHELCAEKASRELLALQLQWSGKIDGTMSIKALRERRAAIHRASTLKQWHRVRAVAQLERFERVASCATSHIKRSCHDCGATSSTHVARCRSVLLCYDCRLRQQAKYRARIREGMERAQRFARTDGRMFRGASPRFLTLTPPHVGSPSECAALMQRAWPRFMRSVVAHLQLDRGWSRRQTSSLYVRRLEATPSDGGHMHLHAWVIWPFIGRALLAHWWGQALAASGAAVDTARDCVCCRVEGSTARHGVRRVCLQSALDKATSELQRAQLVAAAVTRRGPHGRPLIELLEPIVSVRRADSDEAADELAKYICKDIDDGELVTPETFAALFLAFARRRTIAATRGLLTPEPGDTAQLDEWCEECGGFHFDVRMVSSADPATGPPEKNAPPPKIV